MARKPPLSVRLETPDRAWVESRAQALGIPVNQVMREAVAALRLTKEGTQQVTQLLSGPAPAAPANPRTPPSGACPEVLTLDQTGRVLACWLPRTHEGPHLDPRRPAIEWMPSTITREQAAELLAPPPPVCVFCHEENVAAEWFPLFAGYACPPCLIGWGRAVAHMSADEIIRPDTLVRLRHLVPRLSAELGPGAGPDRRLCAHADQDGQGSHWLEPGEVCPRVVHPCRATGPTILGDPACTYPEDHDGAHSWQDAIQASEDVMPPRVARFLNDGRPE